MSLAVQNKKEGGKIQILKLAEKTKAAFMVKLNAKKTQKHSLKVQPSSKSHLRMTFGLVKSLSLIKDN